MGLQIALHTENQHLTFRMPVSREYLGAPAIEPGEHDKEGGYDHLRPAWFLQYIFPLHCVKAPLNLREFLLIALMAMAETFRPLAKQRQ